MIEKCSCIKDFSGGMTTDKSLSLFGFEMREVFRRKDPAALTEFDIAAVVILHDARVHVKAVKIGRCVHMRDKSDGGECVGGSG